ncbi:NAD-dependent epimerase/dehydratase family protein [Paenibacillus rhizovicinus]|uniref:NAD-dependent epimerase/dehydratase family protein n=1 Tax=Paenibacillus rhizovicinus TaxID=2704463 RepID=A0A6C0P2Y3_9BACL|nr:NAD-dependent epimerase/dehydratase family protein [Paenibacillus rhizovicinus]QHW32930.1 NAD-dependent epimerase/dehydratase family protein [Paenibacillus rhizovicinus]
MRIVILGGTGTISTSIVRLLLQQGHDVTCYNRGQSGRELPNGVRVIHGDRGDRETFERVMQEEQFDAAIDMISFGPEDARSSLRAFRGVKHFVQCSTVCTYGVDYDWLPVTEDHPLRPTTGYGRGKVEADTVLMEAYYREGFPVTIMKPSTTYSSQSGILRQVAWDFNWIDRIMKGKPLLVCGDGKALHSFLHADDAAKAFAGVLGKTHCIGQTYNVVPRGFTTWEQHHKLAMQVLGREVELVGVSLETLKSTDAERFSICDEIFAHNVIYSPDKLMRDVPEFVPTVSLAEGMRQAFAAMVAEGRIPNSDDAAWEDEIIEAQREAFAKLANK